MELLAIERSQRGLQLSYTALELHATCSLRYHLERELGLRGGDESAAVQPLPGLGGRRFGVAFHALIQEVDWHSPPGDGWAETRLLELDPLATVGDAERAERHYRAVRDSDIGRRLQASVEVRSERPFVVQIDGAVVSGYLDVWAREADGTVLIVDWKTGHASPGAYELQRELYAQAAAGPAAPEIETAWVGFEPWSVAGGRRLADAPPVAVALGKPIPVAIVRQPFCAGCPGLQAFCPVSATEP